MTARRTTLTRPVAGVAAMLMGVGFGALMFIAGDARGAPRGTSNATGIAAGAATTPTTHTATHPRNDLSGLRNFARVSPHLYRGAQPTAEGFRTLQKMGIKTVVNLRSLHSDTDLLKGTTLKYVHIPCKAWHPEEEDVVQFLKVISDPANQPVFVHCQAGADRTGMMVAAYRVVMEKWSGDEAAKELPVFGFHKVFAEILTEVKKFDAKELRKKAGLATPTAAG